MILAIDIGNTNIMMGLYKDKGLVSCWRICTQKNLTADDYSVILKNLLPFKKIKGVIISSVVPLLRNEFRKLFKKNLELEPMIVSCELNIGITLDEENKKEIGADRIADAVGAHYLYKKGCIVVDLGTAITFDVVSPEGKHLGGAISPGIETSIHALFEKADLLHPISLEETDFLIGRNTTESLQIGIIYGFASLVEGMIEKIREKINFLPLVVLTGGEAHRISKKIKCPHILNPILTLEGLRIIYERHLAP